MLSPTRRGERERRGFQNSRIKTLMTDRIARPQHPAPRSITCISMTPERLPSASIQKTESCRIHQGPSLQARRNWSRQLLDSKVVLSNAKKKTTGRAVCFFALLRFLRTPNLLSKTSRLLSLAYFQSVSALTLCVSLSISPLPPSLSLSLSLALSVCLCLVQSLNPSQECD